MITAEAGVGGSVLGRNRRWSDLTGAVQKRANRESETKEEANNEASIIFHSLQSLGPLFLFWYGSVHM